MKLQRYLVIHPNEGIHIAEDDSGCWVSADEAEKLFKELKEEAEGHDEEMDRLEKRLASANEIIKGI